MTSLATAIDASRLVMLRPHAAIAFERGAVVAIHLAPMLGARLTDTRAAVEAAAALAPRGLAVITVFRLSHRFPFAPGWDSNMGELSDTLRALDRSMAANALVIEFGGLRAAGARLAMRTVRALARPRSPSADFDSLTEAVRWIAPHARGVDAPDDFATYRSLYDEAARGLATLDTTA